MGFVIVWLLCGVAAAMIGDKKGEGCGAFFIGVLFGPFGILFAILSSGNRKTCPYCKDMIHKDAIACPRCQRDLTHPPPMPRISSEAFSPLRRCPKCDAPLADGVTKCEFCGASGQTR